VIPLAFALLQNFTPWMAPFGPRGKLPKQSVAQVDVSLTMVRRPQDSPVTVSSGQPMR
jgi:hypothetical protein